MTSPPVETADAEPPIGCQRSPTDPLYLPMITNINQSCLYRCLVWGGCLGLFPVSGIGPEGEEIGRVPNLSRVVTDSCGNRVTSGTYPEVTHTRHNRRASHG